MAQRRGRQPTRRPGRSRRSSFSRLGRRRAVLTVTAAGLLSVAGVTVAGAIVSSNTSSAVKPVAVASPSVAPAVTPSASQGPVGPVGPVLPAVHTASPAAKASVQPRRTTPTPTATATRSVAAKAPCPSVAQRVDAARALLRHRDALPQVTVATLGPRQGVLGTPDLASHTLSLYVRSCSEESTLRLAVVWAYEAGQFIPVETWDSATRARWQQLRGTSDLVSASQLRQDAASVYAYWQTGTAQWWQSPVAPPSAASLAELSSFLHTA